jgi:hypothetical protein
MMRTSIILFLIISPRLLALAFEMTKMKVEKPYVCCRTYHETS